MRKKYRTVRQKCLDDLRKGMSPSEVRKKHKSDSAYAAALQDFIAEKDPVTEQIQELYQTRNNLSDDIKLKITQKNDLNRQTVDIRKLMVLHERNLEEIKKNERDFTERLDTVKVQYDSAQDNYQKCEKKGISLSLIKRIGILEVTSGEDLLSRIKTELSYLQLKRKFDALKKENAKTEKDLFSNKKRLNLLFTDIYTQKKLFDELQLQIVMIKEAKKIVIEFFSDGYTTDDLRKLKIGLNILALKDKPSRSVQRLIRYFEKATTLTQLDNLILEKETELQTIKSNLAKAKGEFDAISKTFLNVFEDVKKKGLNQIVAISIKTELESQIIKRVVEQLLSELGDSFSQQYQTLNQTAVNSFKNAELTANSITRLLDEATKDSVAFIQKTINQIFKQFKEDITSWKNDMYELNDLKDTLRNYELLTSYAQYFLGFLKYPETKLKEIPLPIIAQFMTRIYSYTQAVFPNAKAFPSIAVTKLSQTSPLFGDNLYTNSEYKLSALALFLSEEFEKKSLEASKRDHKKI